MEHAALQCFQWLTKTFTNDSVFLVLCGGGNNGGDGLAIARMLHQYGFSVKAFLLQHTKEFTRDNTLNFERLRMIDSELVELVPPDTFITDIPSHFVIIDALLGTGLNRPAEGWMAHFIQHINQLPNTKVAIDMPSGLPADNIPSEDAVIMKADYTLSFQFYKRSFLHPETGNYTGVLHLLDIGLNPYFIDNTPSIYNTIDKETLRRFYKKRKPFSHKGNYGNALMIGGSYGMMGAIGLSAKACLRGGVGKMKALIPSCGYQVFQTMVPEAMCLTNGEQVIQHIRVNESFDAIGIGPGIGTSEKMVEALTSFLETCKQALVMDADALNILSKRKELLHLIPKGSVLTPHAKEYERMFGSSVNSMLRLEHARAEAIRLNITIVLKDHHTIVVTPEGECWYNTTGNAGLATAGSGDVLTGLITALMAQGYHGHEAAMLGVWLHGIAGDLCLEKQSEESLIAGDVIEGLGSAFKELQ
jgi:NAD(P)H-hydrate epimerase